MKVRIFAASLLTLFISLPASAVSDENTHITFEGSLTDTSGNAVDLSNQNLFFYITANDTGGNNCVLFAESTTSAGDSSGGILHRFGGGSAVVSPVAYNHTISHEIFNGVTNGKKADGSGVACSVANDSTRRAEVYSAVLNVTGSITLGAVPLAYVAQSAGSLNGKSEDDFVASGTLAGGSNGQVLSRSGSNGFAWITPASATALPDIISAGTNTKITFDSKGRVTAASSLAAADIPNLDVSKLTSGVLPIARGGLGISTIGGANQLLAVNSSGTGHEYKAMAAASGVTVTLSSGAINLGLQSVGMPGNYVKVTVDTFGRVTSGSNLTATDIDNALGFAPANVAGDNFTGNLNTTGNMGVGTLSPTTRLHVNGTMRLGNGGETCTSGFAGAFRYNSGQMEFCNGAVWQALGVTGAGVNPIGTAGGDLSGTYPNPSVANNAITSAKILDGSIANADIASGTITYSKLAIADNDISQAKISGLSTSLAAKENVVSTGTSSQYYRGDKTWQMLTTSVVSEGTNLFFTESRVRSTPLVGYVAASDTTVVAADTVLQAISKIQGQINARWQTSGSDMYFNNGAVTIGSNSFPYPGTKLYIKNSGTQASPAVFEHWDNSAADGVLPVLTISRRLPSGSTPQHKFGSMINFNADNSAKILMSQGAIGFGWGSSATTYSGMAIVTTDSSGSGTTKIYADQNAVIIPNTGLVVSGSVQIGTDNTAATLCNPIEAGKQRYHPTFRVMEYCNGEYWQGINGVTSCTSGFILIGNPGHPEAFCLEGNYNSPLNYQAASNDCAAMPNNRNTTPRVCSAKQLDRVCETTPLSPPLNGGSFLTVTHMTSDGYNASGTNGQMVAIRYTSNTGSCHLSDDGTSNTGRNAMSISANSTANYRCCYE